MGRRMKKTVEYRYYNLEKDFPILPLLGERWIRNYKCLGGQEHFHNCLEIGYCYWGNGTVYIEETKKRFSHGTFTVIPAGFTHSTDCEGDSLAKWEYLFVDVDQLFSVYSNEIRSELKMKMEEVNKRALCLNESMNSGLSKELCEILNHSIKRKEFGELYLLNLMTNFLLCVSKDTLAQEEVVLPGISSKQKEQMMTIVDYIDEHFRENIRICNLSEKCHISESHFRRQFKAVTQKSPLEYIHEKRIEKACELLKTTEYSMLQIAMEVGYLTMATFERNFSKILKETPLKWKNSPQNHNKLKDCIIRNYEGWL